ncbi:MAG: hypothetical protein Q9223_001675 [Gallowayella weberi]
MPATSDVLRPLGMLEKLYPARQVLGVYNSVVITATYGVPAKLENGLLYNLFCASISRLLHRHPSLCCYFEGEHTLKPIFRRLKTIHINDVLQFRSLEQQQSLAPNLQELHDLEWPAGPNPLWKLVVIRGQPNGSVDSTLHIALVYHHVIGDGLSGLAFHKSLLHEISSIEKHTNDLQRAPETIDTPSSTSLLEPIEKLVSLPVSWLFLIRQAVQEYAPQWLVGTPAPFWAGLPTKPLRECPLRSRVRLVSIPTDDSEDLLRESKRHRVTLTSLLTAAIVFALAMKLPEASRFLGITPYTLRRVTGTAMDEMVNQSTAFETDYPAEMLDRIRETSNATEHINNLWTAAAYFYAQMQQELTKCPRDNLVGLLPYVLDYVKFYKKKIGRAREATFEVSNLGVFRTSPEPLPGNWTLEEMTFTQGAQPVGTAFTVNCVSVQGGPLTIAITWQDSVIDEEIVDAIVHEFADLPHLLQHEDPSPERI